MLDSSVRWNDKAYMLDSSVRWNGPPFRGDRYPAVRARLRVRCPGCAVCAVVKVGVNVMKRAIRRAGPICPDWRVM